MIDMDNSLKIINNSTQCSDEKQVRTCNCFSSLDLTIKKNKYKISLQKLQLAEIEEKLFEIKLLQNKAITIAKEKKMKYDETRERLIKCRDCFNKIVDPCLKKKLSDDINKEVSKRSNELHATMKKLLEILAEKNKKREEYESEINSIKMKIIAQKKKRNSLHAQLQKSIQDARSNQLKAEKILINLRKNIK